MNFELEYWIRCWSLYLPTSSNGKFNFASGLSQRVAKGFESLATPSESLASPSLPFCDQNRRLGSAGDEAFNLLMSLLFMCEEDGNKSEARANLLHNPEHPLTSNLSFNNCLTNSIIGDGLVGT